MMGRTNGARVKGLQVWWDHKPQGLSRSQLFATHTYTLGVRPAAFVRPPAPRGSYYPEKQAAYSYEKTLDPYLVVPEGKEPASCPTFDAPERVEEAEEMVSWVDAKTWRVEESGFEVVVDLQPVLQRQGTGVYTFVLWGEIQGERVDLTNYSVLLDVSPAS